MDFAFVNLCSQSGLSFPADIVATEALALPFALQTSDDSLTNRSREVALDGVISISTFFFCDLRVTYKLSSSFYS